MTPAQRLYVEEHARLVAATIRRVAVGPLILVPGFKVSQGVMVAVLVERIDMLHDEMRRMRSLAEIGARAPTEPALPIPGGPCDAYYQKGRTDLARLLAVDVARVINQARLDGKDLHAVERLVLNVIGSYARGASQLTTPTAPTIAAAPVADLWADNA